MAKNGSIAIPISAQDRFSKTLDQLEGRINKLSAPVRRFQSNMNRLSGFGPRQLKRGIMGVSSSALSAAKALGAIVPALGALTGAASLAGVYRLSSAWARAGQNIGITARTIGVAPKRLQLMQSAAKLAGGSADAMASALQGLAHTKFNITTGLDPAALAQFQAFGISLHDISHTSADKLFDRIVGQLRRLKDPVAQAAAAQKLLGSGAQGILPILQQSGKQYANNIALASRYGVMNQAGIDAAGRLANAQSRLELAVQGFGNSLAQNLEPVLTPIVTKMADWIAANRTWISTQITGYVKKLVDWFHDGGWDKIVKWAENFVQKSNDIGRSISKWKTVAVVAAGAIGTMFTASSLASMAAGLGTLTALLGVLEGIAALGVLTYTPNASDKRYAEAKKKDDEKTALKKHYLKRTHSWFTWGFDEKKERALVGQESSFSPSVNDRQTSHPSPQNDTTSLTNRPYDAHEHYDGRIYNALKRKVNPFSAQAIALQQALQKRGFSAPALAGVMANFSQESDFNPAAHNGSHAGLAQWDKRRQEQFQKTYGHTMTAGSLDEQVDFFTHDLAKYPKIQKAIMGAHSAAEAGFAMGRRYEIPGTTDATLRPDVNARAHAAEDWASAMAKPDQNGPQDHHIDVTIHHKNAPDGTSVQISHASPGIRVTGIKTHRAMSPDAVSL